MLNQNLTKTLIYNPQDDYFYLNGVKTIYRGYQNAIPVFANGNFGIEVDNGIYKNDNGYTASAFIISGLSLTGTLNANATSKTLVSNEAINFSPNSKVRVKTTGRDDLVLNVGGSAVTGYLAVVFRKDQYGGTYVQIYISSQKTTFANYTINNLTIYDTLPSATTNVSITEITVE